MRSESNSEFQIPNSEFQRGVRVLLAAEGSGGHLIPALEVSRALVASGAQVCLLYAKRRQTAGLVEALMREATSAGVHVHPVCVSSAWHRIARGPWRVWQAATVWRLAHRYARAFDPQAVVGFGGWFSIPIALMARQRHTPLLLHEQNVYLGRANRLLVKWADQLALSFENGLTGERNIVITGLPVREAIGTVGRQEAARRLGLNPDANTVLILGGSQGAQPINRLVCQMVVELPDRARTSWQFIHLSGASDDTLVQQVYATVGVRAFVAAHLTDMGFAYALADVVIARAGASTIAELARCGIPAVLIPYPYAGGHQGANARLVESVGGGVLVEEATATPQQLFSLLHQILSDERLRLKMADQMRTLATPDATTRLAHSILNLCKRNTG